MRRREFIALAVAELAWASAAGAQTSPAND